MSRVSASALSRLPALAIALVAGLTLFLFPARPAEAARCPQLAFGEGAIAYFKDENCDSCAFGDDLAGCFCDIPLQNSYGLCQGATTLIEKACIDPSIDLSSAAFQARCRTKCEAAGYEPTGTGSNGSGLINLEKDTEPLCDFRRSEQCMVAHTVGKHECNDTAQKDNPKIDQCYCGLDKVGNGSACHGMSSYLKPIPQPKSGMCSYLCGLKYGVSKITGAESVSSFGARCDVRPESQCTTVGASGVGACKRCVCRFNRQHPTASCHGKTTLGGMYGTLSSGYQGTFSPLTADSYCSSLCENLGPGYDFAFVAQGADDYCYYSATDGCAKPLDAGSGACRESAAEQAALSAQLTKGTALSLPLPLSDISVPKAFGRIISGILGIVGSVALLMFVYGGIRWMTAAGNPEAIKQAKQTIVYAVLGLVAIFGAYLIIGFLISNFA